MPRSGLRTADPPLLQLASAKRLLALDPATLAALGDLLSELRAGARREAERAWRKRKAPMARYRLDVATHAAALHRAIRWACRTRAIPVFPLTAADEHKPRSSRASVRNPLLGLQAGASDILVHPSIPA